MSKCNNCACFKMCHELRGVPEDTETPVECKYFVVGHKQGECNQCRYYEGVHGVQGHAPCSFWGIGGVLWSDYCSRFEKEGDKR